MWLLWFSYLVWCSMCRGLFVVFQLLGQVWLKWYISFCVFLKVSLFVDSLMFRIVRFMLLKKYRLICIIFSLCGVVFLCVWICRCFMFLWCSIFMYELLLFVLYRKCCMQGLKVMNFWQCCLWNWLGLLVYLFFCMCYGLLVVSICFYGLCGISFVLFGGSSCSGYSRI